MPRAIETRYKERLFRSRLEARYAVLFDVLAIKWDYEPEGYDLGGGVWYLPDFFVRYPEGHPVSLKHPGAGYWVEVKPISPSPAESNKMLALCKQTGHHGWFFCGSPGEGSVYSCSVGATVCEPFVEGLRHSAPLLMCSPIKAEHRRAFVRGVSDALSARFDGRKRVPA